MGKPRIDLDDTLNSRLTKIINDSKGDITFTEIKKFNPVYMSSATFRVRFRELKYSLGFDTITYESGTRLTYRMDDYNLKYAVGGKYKVIQDAIHTTLHVTGHIIVILKDYPKYYLVKIIETGLITTISKPAFITGEVNLIEC